MKYSKRTTSVLSGAVLAPLMMLSPINVAAEEATDVFEANATVVDATPTCTFSVGSVDFGTLEIGETITDGADYSQSFNIDTDCSSSLEVATLTFGRGTYDSAFIWRLRQAAGWTLNYQIFDASDVALVPGEPHEVLLGTGSQTQVFRAALYPLPIPLNTNTYPAGEYSATVDVTFTF